MAHGEEAPLYLNIFADHAAQYANRGVPVFPVGGDNGKKPLIKHWNKVGTKAHSELSRKFPNANVGFLCGIPSKIVVLDIDTPDRSVLDRALSEFGDTPIKIKTASGNFQAWYRHNGEKRSIRPIPGQDIDILGSGFCVAPPSYRVDVGNSYRFLEGSVDDLRRLPTILPGRLPEEILRQEVSNKWPQPFPKSDAEFKRLFAQGVPSGMRNEVLFHWGLRQAKFCDFNTDLFAVLLDANQYCIPPLSDSALIRIADSAWGYEERGENWNGGPARAVTTQDELRMLTPDELHLLLTLRVSHGARPKPFAIACAAMANQSVSYSEYRIKNARDGLIDKNMIEMVHRGGKKRGDCHKFKFSKPAR